MSRPSARADRQTASQDGAQDIPESHAEARSGLRASTHYRDLELSSTLSMAREFISDYTVTISRDRIVVPELVEKSTFLSRVRNGFFKN